MTKIDLLDKTEGALRLLLTLHKSKEPLNTTDLQKRIDILYSVKKYATATSIQVCASLGLIEIRRGDEKPKAATYHSLTERGRKIAEELSKLETMLEENQGK